MHCVRQGAHICHIEYATIHCAHAAGQGDYAATSLTQHEHLSVQVLKQALSMRAPDVNTVDGRIIISSEEGECDGMSGKPLSVSAFR